MQEQSASRKERKKTVYDDCRNGDASRVLTYIENGGCLTEQDEHGMTMLHHAAFAGNSQIVQALLDAIPMQSVKVDAVDREGWTPLHCSASVGHVEATRILLTHGANVNAHDACRRTPLHLAALNNHTDMAEVLVRHGALRTSKNVAGMTPMESAAAAGHTELSQMLAPA